MGRTEEIDQFLGKLDRELKAGVVSLVLLLVVDRAGPEYGYRLLRHVQEASGGRLVFKEGTAYPLLAGLERQGLLTSYWGDGAGGPPRKYYETTALGRAALERALAEWAELTASVQRVADAMAKEARP
ncbi:MAG TPA: PadR family transcriptional regulator [Candidatus Thermoplasmatota archaeon]|nr:PadR family transcriptional regulator [Candidatus Thermoplasmatota archaeon]